MAVVWNLGLAYVVYMLARVVFLVKNYSYFEQGLTWGHLMEMFGGGLVFDTAAILVTNIPYIVMALLLPWRKPTKWVYMIINSVALAMNLADSVYFKYTMRRTTTTVFSEFQNEGNLGGIIGTEVLQQWYLVVVFGVVVYGVWKLYKESGVRSQESGDRSQESGDRSQESGGRSQESGDRSQETGDRRLETGLQVVCGAGGGAGGDGSVCGGRDQRRIHHGGETDHDFECEPVCEQAGGGCAGAEYAVCDL